MRRILIKSTFDKNCINGTKAKNYALKEIVPHLQAGESILIDFTGVDRASSSFINAIVFNTFGYEVAEKQVQYKANNKIIESMILDAISYLESEFH